MSVTRRDFLKVSGLVLSTAWSEIVFANSLASFESPSGLPILQTFTNENSAQFRVLIETAKPCAYQVCDSFGASLNVEILDRYIHPAWLDQGLEHLMVRNLKLGVEYTLKVVDAHSGDLLDERSFTSLDRFKSSGRAAFISCMCDDFPAVQAEMWKVVSEQNPDVVFLIGDAHYLDGRQSDDEKGIWRRHLEVRRALDLYYWKKLRPVISVWDDHDFGINDGGAEFPLKEATRQMFEAMFGSVPEAGLARGPSLALEASFFGQRYYLMDDRFYRTHTVSRGSHWGDEQEEWLFSRFSASQAPVFLMNGSQYFGAYSGYESFEKEHPEQFQRVLQRLSKQEASIVLVSGDRHFSEVMKLESQILGYESLEMTSSSLHSYRPSTVPSAPNPRRQLATAEFNFLMVESSAEGPHLNLEIQSLGLGGTVLFSRSQKIQRT